MHYHFHRVEEGGFPFSFLDPKCRKSSIVLKEPQKLILIVCDLGVWSGQDMSCHGDDGRRTSEAFQGSTTAYFTLVRTRTIQSLLNTTDLKGHQEFCLGPEGDFSSLSSSDQDDPTVCQQSMNAFSQESDGEHGFADALSSLGFTFCPHLLSATNGKGIVQQMTTKRKASVKISHCKLEIELLRTKKDHFPRLLGSKSLSPLYSLLITELCAFSLKDLIAKNVDEKLPVHPKWIQKILHGCAKALDYLHVRYTAHMNIRLEHVLISHQEASVKLCGLSAAIQCPEKETTVLCQYNGEECEDNFVYRPPEMLPCSDSKRILTFSPFPVDIYSLGVICYWLLLGTPPHPPTPNSAEARKLKFHHHSALKEAPWKIPTESKNLVGLMLCPQARFRPSAARLKYESLDGEGHSSNCFIFGNPHFSIFGHL